MTERDGKLYGRGATDDKGPVLDWINAIEAYRELGQDIPINIKVFDLVSQITCIIFPVILKWRVIFKFCFEGMEESGSENLDEELAKRKDTFLKVITESCK